MHLDQAHQLLSQMLWTGLAVCAPVLGVAMAVGLLISVLQVVTQVQDMSLSFVPKLVAAIAALVIFGPWMLRELLNYATKLILSAPKFL
ncbi:flagellar biosynthetic protein FliQ [Chitinimonas sp. BJB300]|uniref:flagellar biosynthetic protein FliQ n=1 Tax=Chitinimonas sp. BJB300 TaxID=1559339 RepID=UPI000C0D7B72|nr:flagellar biosynthetic protein FliQ [Chitinimonas sp. BJB300]PHV12885.1 flagellar biosynthetic protein FliQ [Chitinimonas sp. BJB300]TSJ86082.1 flagellar biosynthetic protein FliQ [Chitinimonas sp. BJB300]